jgi:hypothetical protein
LPLFGNIPVAKPSGWTLAQLPALGIPTGDRSSWLLIGMFGAVHPEWRVAYWWDHLVRQCRRSGLRIGLLGIGKVARTEMSSFRSTTERCRRDGVVHHFGEQPADRISDFLQTIDGGIATVSPALLGKSGTAAAMAEHNVPLLLTRVDASIATASVEDLIDRWLALLRVPRKPRLSPAPLEMAARLFSQQLLETVGERRSTEVAHGVGVP